MTPYLVDGRALQEGSAVRGIGTYLRGLLEGIGQVGLGSEVMLLLKSGASVPADVTVPARIAPARLASVPRRMQPLLDPLLVSLALARLRPRLYHGVEYGQPLLASVPVVITVHDLIPFVMPTLYPWMRRERLLGLRLLRHADALIADSYATCRDLVARARVDPTHVTVIHPGVAGEFRPRSADDVGRTRDRLGLTRPYLIAVGTFDPRKRVDLLARVVRDVRRNHDVDLVITGDQGNFTSAVEWAIAEHGISGHCHLLGHIPRDLLITLYSGASCLVFTSAYEGFGLPLLEAMACGTPTVAFANSSIPEVAGDAGMLVPDGDTGAMVATILTLLGEGAEAERRRLAGLEQARRFTWRRTAEETLAVYRSLAA